MYERPEIAQLGQVSAILRALLPSGTPQQPQLDWRVSRLKNHLDRQNGNLRVTLASLCRELKLGICSAHAARIFKQQTGMSVRTYAARQRFMWGAERLLVTDLCIKSIAWDAGYQSAADFTRGFKQVFRVSPKEYRTVYRANCSAHTRLE